MAYNLATIRQIDPASADRAPRLVVEFTGNAGEPPVRKERYVDGTAAQLAAWARGVAAELNAKRAVVGNLTVGQTLSLAAPATPTPTAEEVWLEKAKRLMRARELGLANQGAIDVAALQSDVNATYQTGYLLKL